MVDQEVKPSEGNLRKLDVELAPVMFAGAMTFLVCCSVLLHLSDGDLTSRMATIVLRTLALVFLAFPLEILFHWFEGGKVFGRHWLAVLLPPLRIATPDHSDGTRIWLPWFGWQKLGPELEHRLQEFFSLPMMALALIVLPLIVCEFVWSEKIESDSFFRLAFQGATAMIWVAFVTEFVIMFSVTKNKKKYLIRNWIDVVVILLPLVAFLRTLRLARLLRLNQVTRSVRLYRVRGVLLRTWRAIVALDILERILFRDPNVRILRLQEALTEKEQELEMIRTKISKLKKQKDPDSQDNKPVEIAESDRTINRSDLRATTIGPAALDQLNSGIFRVARQNLSNNRTA